MKQFIEITNFKIFSYHGYYEEEQKLGNWFKVSAKIGLFFTKAAESDDIEGTLNYEKILYAIEEQMKIKSKLLENVAMRISKNIISLDNSITSLDLTISKLLLPIAYSVESAAISLHFDKNDINLISKDLS